MLSLATEKAFENALVNHLSNDGGYQLGAPTNFSPRLCLLGNWSRHS